MSDCKNCQEEDVPLNNEGLCPTCAESLEISRVLDEDDPREPEDQHEESERWDGLS